jgi:hypothetical protein
MKILNFIFKSVIFLCFSCSFSNEDQEFTKIEMEDITLQEINIEEIILNVEQSSFVGFFEYKDHTLYYVDQIYSTISTFNQEFDFEKTFLGRGEGPSNQNVINGFKPFALGNQHIILGSNEFVFHTPEFLPLEKVPIQWLYDESFHQMANSPKATMVGLYEINWKGKGNNNNFLVLPKDSIAILPVEMSHPQLNGYQHEEYYQTVSIFGLYNLEKRKIDKVKGLRTQAYLDYKFIPNFDFMNFTAKGDSILVSFPPDHLIHIFDSGFNLIGQFGKERTEINRKYPKTSDPEEALPNSISDLSKAGYYDHIYYDEKSGLVFRSYFPEGKNKGYSKIQIFKNHILIGDFMVPERFKVLGSDDNYFYADGLFDEKNEILGIYKFQLK